MSVRRSSSRARLIMESRIYGSWNGLGCNPKRSDQALRRPGVGAGAAVRGEEEEEGEHIKALRDYT